MMHVTARVENRAFEHTVTLKTDGRSHTVQIAPKPTGYGSATNGGELLALALATCYCNDLYREAAARNIAIESVGVEVHAEFGGPGEPASRLTYSALVKSDAPVDVINDLLRHTDRVAEVHNTLRKGIDVVLEMRVALP